MPGGIEDKLKKLVAAYNAAFAGFHAVVSGRARELASILKGPAVQLIEAFERINFRNIKRIEDLHNELRGIKVCNCELTQEDDEPLNCSCTGSLAGLAGLVDQLQLIKRTDESIRRQVGNIGGNHVAKLLSLDNKAEGRTVTLGDYLRAVDVKKTVDEKKEIGEREELDERKGISETEGVREREEIDEEKKASEKEEKNTRFLVRDWEALKGYLEKGFENLAESNAGEAIRLLTRLSRHINSYLAECEVSKNQQESKEKARKKIGFSRLYAEIRSEIVNSGYKVVTVDDFARTLIRVIDRAKKEYDDVDIDG